MPFVLVLALEITFFFAKPILNLCVVFNFTLRLERYYRRVEISLAKIAFSSFPCLLFAFTIFYLIVICDKWSKNKILNENTFLFIIANPLLTDRRRRGR